MRITLIHVLLLIGLAQSEQVRSELPTVTSLFVSRDVEGGPAFLVECRNATTAAISSGSDTWALTRSAIRIDRTVLDEQGRIGPGLTSDIPPGGTWKGIIALRHASPRTP